MCLWTEADTPIEKAQLVLQPMTHSAQQQRCADCGVRTQLLDPRTDSERIFLRTLRTLTDTDHNFSPLNSWTSLVLRGGFHGGQCLITVQLPYNSACISIFIQRSRCYDTINSIKILHAVRSAITAIAVLLVLSFFTD